VLEAGADDLNKLAVLEDVATTEVVVEPNSPVNGVVVVESAGPDVPVEVVGNAVDPNIPLEDEDIAVEATVEPKNPGVVVGRVLDVAWLEPNSPPVEVGLSPLAAIVVVDPNKPLLVVEVEVNIDAVFELDANSPSPADMVRFPV